ncbi:uncharacterized protein LOC122839254 isoform X2 [Gambusia affinis]|uniref:uncharacterized protein LOC122839254 isoform X2 n=1 Tax=Gambusia affinis TaxID=33528 RepID=UPI001CDBB24B|nr:uncharacterized protein LOC122839254 isoform X2 [Gambusia affinis]
MLGTLQEEEKLRWKDFVQPLVHAYNCTKNDTTGYSPYQLMFGRQPNLPIDIAFGLNKQSGRGDTHCQYVKGLRASLTESYKIAIEHSEKTASYNKQRFDTTVRESKLEVGDRVLVKNVGLRGKHKISNKWTNTVYKVIKQIENLPVYVVTPFDAEGPERVLHRDLLLPCGFLSVTKDQPEPRIQNQLRKSKRLRSSATNRGAGNEISEDLLSDSKDEDAEYYYYPPIKMVTDVGTRTNEEPDEDMQTEPEHHMLDTNELAGERTEPGNAGLDVTNEHVSLPPLNPEASPFEPQEPKETISEEKQLRNHHEENVEVRRSTRERTHPKRLTYPSLGNPLVVVMQSLLGGLDKALQVALESDLYAPVFDV